MNTFKVELTLEQATFITNLLGRDITANTAKRNELTEQFLDAVMAEVDTEFIRTAISGVRERIETATEIHDLIMLAEYNATKTA